MVSPDLATATRWISHHFPPPNSLHRLGEGDDYVVFATEDAWVYRFPKEAGMVPRLRAEIAILPRLQHLPIPVPLPERVGEPRDDQPLPFVGYRRLDGVSVAEASPDPIALLDAIDAFLDELHAVPRAAPFTLAVEWPDEPLCAPHPVAEAVVEFLEAQRAPPGPAAFCHNDLGMNHVLLDPESGRPTGVLDWGDCTWTDRAVDWVGLVWAMPDVLDAVRARQQPERLARAWWHGLRFGLLDCLDHHENGADERTLAKMWAKLEQRLDRARRSPVF